MHAMLKKASGKNIRADLENLGRFNSTPGEGLTRILFTEQELKARTYIKDRMRELGLSVHEDAIGNIFGRLPGTDPELSPVWTGSHIDTVPHAGQFDGMAGVVGGMEALRLIGESGRPHARDLEVVVFTSEEPTRFGKGCLGSRALAGDLTRDEAAALTDAGGNTLRDVLAELGYDEDGFSEIKRERGSVYACVELHIEQGAVLENLGIKTGVVTAISAPTDLRVTVKGTQQHAGATPMYLRKDALTAAARIMLKAEELARRAENVSTVATVGAVRAYPGATNVIPGRVEFSVDLRSSDLQEKNGILETLRCYMEFTALECDVDISEETVCHEHPARADSHIIQAIRTVCDEKNEPYHLMVSGAYHDSMFVARFAPFGMIFVPSRGGISHHRDEWTDYGDIALGADILAETLLRLSSETPETKETSIPSNENG